LKPFPFQFKFTLAKVLNRLSQYRIIWQYKNENATGPKLSQHIKPMTWLPQPALLGHPKTRLFVTHAGVKSMMESICFRTPTVTLPFFADQMLNGIHLRAKKCGLIIEKGNFTEQIVFATFSRVLNDETFQMSIAKLSEFNRQGMILPQHKLATFWTEFVLRHGDGLKKFTTRRGMMMGYIKYYNIDVLFVAILICVLCFCIFLSFVRKLSSKLH